jgi:dipeptidyl aminopeptidase/acylaminoacyl peptidase
MNFQGTIEHMRTLTLLLAGLLSLYAQEGGKTAITAADLLKIKQVGQIEVAPDGSFAVYSVRSMYADVPKEGAPKDADVTYGYRSHLWRVDLNAAVAKPVQLTFGDRNDTTSALSPDGRTLAFVRLENAAPPQRPKPQVFLLRLDVPGEAQPVTKLEQGVGSVAWRPDGKALLVSSEIPLSKIEGTPQFSMDRPGREYESYTKEQLAAAKPDGDLAQVRAWLHKNGQRDNPTVITRMNFLGEQGLAPEMAISQLFLVELDKENKTTQLTKVFRTHGNAQWTPDGKWVFYTSWPEGKQHPDRVRRSAVRVMKADGTEDHAVLDDEKRSWQLVRVSLDGSQLLTLVSDPKEGIYSQGKLALTSLDGKTVKTLAADWDAGPQGADFLDASSVVFVSGWQGGMPLLRARASGKTEVLTENGTGVQAMAVGGGKVVYALTQVSNPNELYVRDSSGKARRLTDLNTEWLSKKTIVLPEEKWLTRPDGKRVQYWVMNPAGAVAGKKYPWVLDMHGGPAAMWGPGEMSMWHEFQIFCAWGYGVTYANPRGSSGYGQAFLKGNFKDWGHGPAGDVLAALDETLKSNGFADKDKLFLTGGSYAGYLTAWIVGHDRRFKAAAAQRGVYDLATFYGEGNAYRLVEGAFGGYPWEPAAGKLLVSESPFSYVAQIQTPLLILHASQDLRTGVTQSQMLYRALQQQGKPVEYVRYPSEGHELTRSGNPGRRMDHMLRILEFFARYQ